jgi:hypothetical protein
MCVHSMSEASFRTSGYFSAKGHLSRQRPFRTMVAVMRNLICSLSPSTMQSTQWHNERPHSAQEDER